MCTGARIGILSCSMFRGMRGVPRSCFPYAARRGTAHRSAMPGLGKRAFCLSSPAFPIQFTLSNTFTRPCTAPSGGPRTAPCVDPVLKERPTAPSLRRRVTAVGGASARIAVLGSDKIDPGAYPTAEPCRSASLQRNLGLCRDLKYTRCTSSAVA